MVVDNLSTTTGKINESNIGSGYRNLYGGVLPHSEHNH